MIAAEDTRHSAQLLRHFEITTPLCSYHEHSSDHEAARLCDRIAAGEAIALISDAGTPLISDPGFKLVRMVQERGMSVVPLPGPSAALCALSGSGIPSDRFFFEGFLPAKKGPRDARLSALQALESTLIFYEAPHRILDTLIAMTTILGAEREATLARELTKTFETLKRLPLGELTDWVAGDSYQQKGEIVLVVAGFRSAAKEVTPEARQWLERLALDLPPRQAAKIVAEMTGINTRVLYECLLSTPN
jgi:16S rRNA (cytidine1402-2'-O)-methyltransferase